MRRGAALFVAIAAIGTFHGVAIADQSTDVNNLKLGVQSLTDTVIDQQKQIDALKKKQSESYGSLKLDKFSITGLIQSRAVQADSGNHIAFPQGSNNSLGVGAAYNGSYAMDGSAGTLEVKRARIIMLGQPDPTTTYKMQLDVAGAVNSPTANAFVKVLEAYGKYTPGDGSSKYPSITMGEFANPYGYILPLSPAGFITPERPLAFSENTNVGMWDSQDYDKGLKLTYGPKNVTLIYAAVNGAGRNSENIYDHFDSLYRVGYASDDKLLNAGISYYDGQIYQAGTADKITTPIGKKELLGLDAEGYTKHGSFLIGEYERGTYEKVGYFAPNGNGTYTFAATNDVKGNMAQGYYIWGGHTYNKQSNHAFTLAADYDVFQRSLSDDTKSFKSGSSYDDVNYGFGTMYNLDKATRLRLWYDKPLEVAHEYGTMTPPRYGLYTAEMQFSF